MLDDCHSSQSGVRIFDDDAQRIWSAGRERSVCGSDVLVFSCISDARQPARAVATDDARSLSTIESDALRRWLAKAPRIGRAVP